MLGKLIDFVVGREPVATATGIASLVTAALGVAAAFGLSITTAQIAAVGALAAALAGFLGRQAVTPVAGPRERSERGSFPLALIILIGLAVIVMAGLGLCGDSLFEDEDEVNDLGVAVTQLAYHEECWDEECSGGDDYSQDYSSDDRNRNRGRNRGAFSPGPFDRSPVDFRDNCISLDCGGRERREEPPR